ncbi:MAG: rod shape-determining protein RodA [Flavobacteriales bacterium]
MQNKSRNIIFNIDWFVIFLYILIAGFGVLSINAVDHAHALKQIIWVSTSIPIIIITCSLNQSFYERFSGLFYLICILLLAGLFVFGETINGATAWYSFFGFFSIQPTEFSKIGVALIISNFLATPKLEMNKPSTLFIALGYLVVPLILIKLQPDDGSVLVFSAFFIGLLVYRVWMVKQLFLIGITFLILFILGIAYSDLIQYFYNNFYILIIGISCITLIIFIIFRFVFYINKPTIYLMAVMGILFCIGTIFASEAIFSNLKPHQKDRIEILFLDDTNKKIRNEKNGYNLYTAKSAIASGELYGKGYLKGDMPKGNIVPEQETDYIFTVIGEEWGFMGSSVFIMIYGIFLLRLFWLAHRQRTIFSSYFGYSVAGIFTVHFIINIAMVMGIFPTIGIPLPFLSYGGSSLWGFTLMLFIMIRLDAERMQVLR